jgi:hypothetical protein
MGTIGGGGLPFAQSVFATDSASVYQFCAQNPYQCMLLFFE